MTALSQAIIDRSSLSERNKRFDVMISNICIKEGPCQFEVIAMSGFYTIALAGAFALFLTGLRFLASIFSGPSDVGNSDFILRGLRQCPSGPIPEDFNFQNFKQVLYGTNSYLYSADITLQRPLTEDIDARTEISVSDFAGYRDHTRQFDIKSVCHTLRYFSPALFSRILQATNSTDCPIPEGTYQLDNIPLEVISPLAKLSKFPYGKYRTTIYINDKQRSLACFMTYYDIVPKK